jgi:hypothetical protein
MPSRRSHNISVRPISKISVVGQNPLPLWEWVVRETNRGRGFSVKNALIRPSATFSQREKDLICPQALNIEESFSAENCEFVRSILVDPSRHASSRTSSHGWSSPPVKETNFEREQREWLATISNRPEHASEAARQELREWVAAISDVPADELNEDEPDEWSPARQEFFDWLAAVSTAEIPAQYRTRTNRSRAYESHGSESPVNESGAAGSSAPATRVHEQWDPAKHPRGGYPQNRGWWSPAGGTGNSSAGPIARVALRPPPVRPAPARPASVSPPPPPPVRGGRVEPVKPGFDFGPPVPSAPTWQPGYVDDKKRDGPVGYANQGEYDEKAAKLKDHWATTREPWNLNPDGSVREPTQKEVFDFDPEFKEAARSSAKSRSAAIKNAQDSGVPPDKINEILNRTSIGDRRAQRGRDPVVDELNKEAAAASAKKRAEEEAKYDAANPRTPALDKPGSSGMPFPKNQA